MKKIIALVMVGTMAITGLVGCTKKGDSPDATTKSSKIVIGFSQIGAESGWRGAETDSVKGIPTLDSNVEVKFSDGQQKQENQIKAIRTFIQQKVDVIALAPVIESGWDTVLKEAKDAKIPVVLLDRMVKVDDQSLYTTFIGSDFILEGQTVAKYLVDKVGKDKPLNIVELQGTVGASAATDRQKGFAEGIKVAPLFKITKSQSGDFTRAKGKEVMEAFLKADKTINAVYAHNDDMALGAIQAVEEAGLKPGKDIMIFSIDGVKDGIKAVADGKINYIVECNPLLGPQLLEAAKKLKSGGSLDKWIKSKEGAFDQAAAKEALPNRKY